MRNCWDDDTEALVRETGIPLPQGKDPVVAFPGPLAESAYEDRRAGKFRGSDLA